MEPNSPTILALYLHFRQSTAYIHQVMNHERSNEAMGFGSHSPANSWITSVLLFPWPLLTS
jgi:hypothetical protein